MNNISFSGYTSEKYSFLIGKNNYSEISNFDIFILNELTKERAMQRGHPDWTYFEPIDPYVERIEKNEYLISIYESSIYDVYVNNHK